MLMLVVGENGLLAKSTIIELLIIAINNIAKTSKMILQIRYNVMKDGSRLYVLYWQTI